MAEETRTRAMPVTLPQLKLGRRTRLGLFFLRDWSGFALVAVLGFYAGYVFLNAPQVIHPPFDDSYISLVFARNLAEHGKLTFDGIHWSTGATSPLHVSILALLIKLGVEPIDAGLWLGVGSHAALCSGVWLLTWAIFRSRLAALLSGSAMAFICYAAFDAGNGLETSLFMAVVSFAMATYFLGRSTWLRAATGVLVGLAVLARPEGAFLLPAFVVYRWFDRERYEPISVYLRDCLIICAPGVAALAFTAILSLSVNDSLGGTASAKYKFFQDYQLAFKERLTLMMDNVSYFTSPLLTLIGIGLVAVKRREGVLFALFWLPVLVFYCILFPGGMLHYFFRYQHPILPFIAVFAGAGAAIAIQQAWRSNIVAKLLVIALLVVVVTPLYYQYNRWKGVYAEASRETMVELEPMAIDLNSIIKPNETLATHDIGAVSYFADYQVLDLVGLVNPKVIPYHKDRRVSEYIDGARPDYLLTFPEWDAYFLHIYPGDNPEKFQLIKVYEGGPIRISPYILYKINYDD